MKWNSGAILLCIVLQLIACDHNSRELSVTLEKGPLISIPIDDSTINRTNCYQFLKLNGINYYAILNDRSNIIQIYNFYTQEMYKRIPLFREGPKQNSGFGLNGFTIKNFDSILIVSTMPHLIYMINSDNQLLKKIEYKKLYENQEVLLTFPIGNGSPILVDHQLHLIHQLNLFQYNFELNDQNISQTKLAFCVDIINDTCRLLDITYPTELINRSLIGIGQMRITGENDNLVYKFSYGDGIYVTNDNRSHSTYFVQTTRNHSFPDIPLSYFSDFTRIIKARLSKNEYRKILYDRFRNVYYFFIQEPIEVDNNTDIKTKSEYPFCSIIILDSEFGTIGEIILEDNTLNINISFVSDKGLYISEDHPENPDFDEDKMTFRLFTLSEI